MGLLKYYFFQIEFESAQSRLKSIEKVQIFQLGNRKALARVSGPRKEKEKSAKSRREKRRQSCMRLGPLLCFIMWFVASASSHRRVLFH